MAGFRPVEVREDAPVAAWRRTLDLRSKTGRMLEKSYLGAVARLRSNFLAGEVVPVPRDPRFDGVANLRCLDLADFHRLLYTVIRMQEGTFVLIIAVLPHPEYDRLFRVRKK